MIPVSDGLSHLPDPGANQVLRCTHDAEHRFFMNPRTPFILHQHKFADSSSDASESEQDWLMSQGKWIKKDDPENNSGEGELNSSPFSFN
jgi:hypothetical protein